MAQANLNLPNQSRTAYRAQHNDVNVALASKFSGVTAPAAPVAFQWWQDLTSGLLKMRNAANNSWEACAVLIASQAQAEAGLDNTKAMTPLSTAQAISALVQGAPVASVCYFAKATAPVGWVKANGALLSRTAYADLFSEIGVVFGAGDGSTTFQIPDLRGEFLRGWDDGRSVDTSRAFGSAQADELRSHRHTSVVGASGPGSQLSVANQNVSSSYTGYFGGAETRPRNVALLACIKY